MRVVSQCESQACEKHKKPFPRMGPMSAAYLCSTGASHARFTPVRSSYFGRLVGVVVVPRLRQTHLRHVQAPVTHCLVMLPLHSNRRHPATRHIQKFIAQGSQGHPFTLRTVLLTLSAGVDLSPEQTIRRLSSHLRAIVSSAVRA